MLVGELVALQFVARDELLGGQTAAVRCGVFLDLEVGHREANLVGLLQDLVGHLAHVALQRIPLFAFDLEQRLDLVDQAGVVLRVHLGNELRAALGSGLFWLFWGRDQCLQERYHVGVAAFRARAVIGAEQLFELHRRDLALRLGGVLLGDQLLLQDVASSLRLLHRVACLLDGDLLVGAHVDQTADIEFDQLVAGLH